jgi:tellurite resistance protein
MADRYANTSATPAAGVANDFASRDQELVQALVTTGALVALADGRLEDVERDELVGFIERQGFAPTISRDDTAKAFDSRIRELEERYSPNTIIEALRPLAGLSLTSIVVRTAERVAAADRTIHPGEQQAIELIRLIMMNLPGRRPMATLSRSPTVQRLQAACADVLDS